MNRSLIGSIYGRSSIGIAHFVLLILSSRGEEFLKSANQKQESPVVAMFVNGSGQIEQTL
jgi:hypothetical protein